MMRTLNHTGCQRIKKIKLCIILNLSKTPLIKKKTDSYEIFFKIY